MEDSVTTSTTTAAPHPWAIIPAIAAGWLVLGINYAAGFLFPVWWEWAAAEVTAIFTVGAVAAWIAPRRREVLTFAVLAAGVGLLTIVRGCGWFYYSLGFLPVTLIVTCGVLALGYSGGMFLRRFRVRHCAVLAVLSCVFIAEVTALFARDGYLLIRYAKPRDIAFNDTEPSWFFFLPAERALGLASVAQQCSATEPARAKRIFQQALHAADQIPKENHTILFQIAERQIKAGRFEDAVTTIRHIRDRFQFELHLGIIASEIARHNAGPQAQSLFDLAIQQALRQQEQQRDRDLYLIGYRQWESGLFNESRRTAELIQAVDSKADLLDRLNDSFQIEVARQQAASRHFEDAAATVKQHVKDPYRYCDSMMSIAMQAATNAAPDHARRILGDALQSAQQLESPGGRNSLIADIALRQFDLGFQSDCEQTLAAIDHPGIKDEVVKKLHRSP